jgi:tetratricopeptide (TPR) repeat protein
MSLPAHAEKEIAPPSPSPIRRRRVRWWMLFAGLAVVGLAGWWGGRYLWGIYHLRAAQQALREYEFQKALNNLDCCLLVWPRDGSTRLKAARAARRADQLQRAEEHLSVCERTGVTAQSTLERSLLRAQKGDSPEVEFELAGLVRQHHPQTVLILEAVARGCMRVYRRRDAISLLSHVVELTPDHSAAHAWLGSQYLEEGLVGGAIPSYQKAVELAPHRSDYRLDLAEALTRFSQPSEAWPHFELLLRQSPHEPAVLLGAARCCRALGRYSVALERLDTLLAEQPDHAEAWAERGRVCRDEGNHSEAIRSLRRAFELAPNSYRIAFALLTELRGEKKTQEASVLLDQLERLSRDSRRLNELTAQLGKQPNSAVLRYQIGMIYMGNRMESEGERMLLGALRYDPDYPPAHAALADYYERTGDSAAALRHRLRAGKDKR